MLALIHSEVSEALECDHKNIYFPKHKVYPTTIEHVNGWIDDDSFKDTFICLVKDTFEDELADIMIRVMDLVAHKGVDLESHIKAMMRYNSLREYKHGKRYW